MFRICLSAIFRIPIKQWDLLQLPWFEALLLEFLEPNQPANDEFVKKISKLGKMAIRYLETPPWDWTAQMQDQQLDLPQQQSRKEEGMKGRCVLNFLLSCVY